VDVTVNSCHRNAAKLMVSVKYAKKSKSFKFTGWKKKYNQKVNTKTQNRHICNYT